MTAPAQWFAAMPFFYFLTNFSRPKSDFEKHQYYPFIGLFVAVGTRPLKAAHLLPFCVLGNIVFHRRAAARNTTILSLSPSFSPWLAL